MGKYSVYQNEILKYCRVLSEQGYFGAISGTGGNISLRVEGEEALAITPSSMKYREINTDDISVVDFDQNPIECKHKPSVETGMHIAVYQRRMDVNAVIHTHQVYASIFSLINVAIPALFDEATLALGKTVDVVPYGLSGTPELAKNVTSKLDNRCNAYILQNHGALLVGKNMDKAFTCVELLEKVAKVYYFAMVTGKPISRLPDMVQVGMAELTRMDQEAEIQRKRRY